MNGKQFPDSLTNLKRRSGQKDTATPLDFIPCCAQLILERCHNIFIKLIHLKVAIVNYYQYITIVVEGIIPGIV